MSYISDAFKQRSNIAEESLISFLDFVGDRVSSIKTMPVSTKSKKDLKLIAQ
jgi:hypothetical protein